MAGTEADGDGAVAAAVVGGAVDDPVAGPDEAVASDSDVATSSGSSAVSRTPAARQQHCHD